MSAVPDADAWRRTPHVFFRFTFGIEVL